MRKISQETNRVRKKIFNFKWGNSCRFDFKLPEILVSSRFKLKILLWKNWILNFSDRHISLEEFSTQIKRIKYSVLKRISRFLWSRKVFESHREKNWAFFSCCRSCCRSWTDKATFWKRFQKFIVAYHL